MYAFVEKWITDCLGVGCDPYGMPDGAECSIVDREIFTRIHRSFLKIRDNLERMGHNCPIGITVVPSAIEGMRLILMRHWHDISVLDNLTNETVKHSLLYAELMRLGNNRFDLELARAVLSEAYNSESQTIQLLYGMDLGSPGGSRIARRMFDPAPRTALSIAPQFDFGAIEEFRASNPILGLGIPPAQQELNGIVATIRENEEIIIADDADLHTVEAQDFFSDEVLTVDTSAPEIAEVPIAEDRVVEPIPEAEPTPQKPSDIGYGIITELVSDFRNLRLHKRDSDEYSIVTDSAAGSIHVISDELFQFANSVKRHVIFSEESPRRIETFLSNLSKSVNVSDYIVCISRGHTEYFSVSVNSDSNYCSTAFGVDTMNLMKIVGSRSNEIIETVRMDHRLDEEQKNIKIAEILVAKKNSPFSKFDCVFKDTYTGTVVAVRKGFIIYTLCQDRVVSKFFKTCLIEIARRFNMDIPYQDLLKIDKEYFDNANSSAMDEYVNMAADGANAFLNDIIKERDGFRDSFNKYMGMAMEAAKGMQRQQDVINAFDVEKFKGDEKRKSIDNFNNTIGIEKVSAIRVGEDGKITVYTKNIYATDERTERYHDLGTFKIVINMLNPKYDNDNTVRVYNTKYVGYGMEATGGKFHAPHVWGDGHVCHGNFAFGMAAAYQKRDLFDLVYQIILFLESANTSDGAGMRINTWPEVSKDEALGLISNHDDNLVYAPKPVVEEKFDNDLDNFLPRRSNANSSN